MVATATNRLISFLNRASQALACYLDWHWCPRYCTTSELYAELLFLFKNQKSSLLLLAYHVTTGLSISFHVVFVCTVVMELTLINEKIHRVCALAFIFYML